MTVVCAPLFEEHDVADLSAAELSSGMEGLELVARAAKIGLYDWQRRVFTLALAEDDAGDYLHDVVVVLVGRQQGKTMMAHLRAGLALLTGEVGAYTAQDRAKAAQRWSEGLAVWRAAFGERLKVRRANGSESAWIEGGGEIRVLTPSADGSRGDTLDLVIVDEAYRHDLDTLQSAIEPTMLTKTAPQLWLLSNAGDHNSSFLRHYRDLGRAGKAGMAYFEWAAPEDADGADRDVWAMCMPSLGVGTPWKRIEAAFERTSPVAWDREYLNRWPLDESGAGVIDMTAWAACSNALVMHDDASLCIGVAVNMDRDCAVIVAASLYAGVLSVEMAEIGRGPTTWVAGAVADLVAKHQGCRVAVNAVGSSATVATQLAQQGIEVIEISPRKWAQACALVQDRITTGTLAHLEHPDLTAAAAVVNRRRLAGAWAWAEPARRDGEPVVEVAPLEAATAAAWGALTVKADVGPLAFVVDLDAPLPDDGDVESADT